MSKQPDQVLHSDSYISRQWDPESGELIIKSEIIYPSKLNQLFQEKNMLSDFCYVVDIKKQLCKNTEILQDLITYKTVTIFSPFLRVSLGLVMDANSKQLSYWNYIDS